LNDLSTLVVGDMHVTTSELEDSGRLIDGISSLPYKRVVFTGDQFHTHSVLHLEVVNFWHSVVERLCQDGKILFFLVGNHERSTSGSGPHALQVLSHFFKYNPNCGKIIDRPTVVPSMGVAIPYCHTHDEFEEMQKQAFKISAGEHILLCHQTFAGAEYENGFYAQDGISLDKLLFTKVISGHIHKSAVITNGRVIIEYVGSPRWRTKSDSGQVKHMIAFPGGVGGGAVYIPTDTWCTPIEQLEDADGDQDPLSNRKWPNSKLTVTVRGTPERVRIRAAELQARGIAVLPRPTAQVAPRVSESAPVMSSFRSFIKEFKAPNGTSGEELIDTAMRYEQWQR
jgi:hypothetical protein